MSKTHPAGDLPKSASLQTVEAQKVLWMDRKKLVLVGMDIDRHMVDLVV